MNTTTNTAKVTPITKHNEATPSGYGAVVAELLRQAPARGSHPVQVAA